MHHSIALTHAHQVHLNQQPLPLAQGPILNLIISISSTSGSCSSSIPSWPGATLREHHSTHQEPMVPASGVSRGGVLQSKAAPRLLKHSQGLCSDQAAPHTAAIAASHVHLARGRCLFFTLSQHRPRWPKRSLRCAQCCPNTLDLWHSSFAIS